MKTASEFAKEATKEVISKWSDVFFSRDAMDSNVPDDWKPEKILESFFQQAIDQALHGNFVFSSLQWQDGPPTEDGMYLCNYNIYWAKGKELYVNRDCTMVSMQCFSGVNRHIGPIPDTPEKPKPEPLFRRFECEIDGTRGCGVKFQSGDVQIECNGIHYSYASGDPFFFSRRDDFDESYITKWLDLE